MYVYMHMHIYILTYICMYVDTHTYGIETDRTPARSIANDTRCAAQRNRRSAAKWTAAVAAAGDGDGTGGCLALSESSGELHENEICAFITLSCRRSFSPWPGADPALARRWPGAGPATHADPNAARYSAPAAGCGRR
jgi:hypothetical protein